MSQAGVRWRVEIHDADYTGTAVGELTFEGDEPLVITWSHTDKEEVVQGSEATLRIESPGDRTYIDLYTIAVGRIRMDIYRDGQLYWSGALDPEFYEEPYERLRNYPVALTFSDFGILDRLKYQLTGIQTLQAILLDAIWRSGTFYAGQGEQTLLESYLDFTTFCSTYFPDSGTKATLDALSVRSDNFTDEEGEQSTLLEVLEGIMQPLGMRLVQRGGRLWVYDLNGLCTAGQKRLIEWDGASQTLGVDKVANNVNITFSPYADGGKVSSDEVEYLGEVDMENTWTECGKGRNGEDGGVNTFFPDYERKSVWDDSPSDQNNFSFSIFRSWNAGDGVGVTKGTGAMFFHIEPIFGGSKSDGVGWGFYSGPYNRSANKPNALIGQPIGRQATDVVMTTRRMYLPPIDSASREQFRLRLTLEALLDARYNPFEEANEWNEDVNHGWLKEFAGYVQVPVAVTLYNAAGVAIYHYDNADLSTKQSGTGDIARCLGEWKQGAASGVKAWLEWWDTTDRNHNAAVGGWKKNRHNVGLPTGDIIGYTTRIPEGQYLPYPPAGGYVEVTVYAGLRCYDFTGSGVEDKSSDFRSWLRWQLYKAPTLEVVRNGLKFDAADLDDVEYSGTLNAAAKEEISIDTICGTAENANPTARGIYLRTSTGLQVQKLRRAGVTDHPEKLLIATLYSQYAERKTVLSGECRTDSGGVAVYQEQNQPMGSVFLLSEDRQNLIADDSEAVFTELAADEYEEN